MERIDLAPGYGISRVIRGGWQLAGGHGPVERDSAIEDLAAFHDAGITTFDCADIYVGVEELIGAFRADTLAKRGADALARLKVHTKFVPDLDILPRIDRAYVRGIIERSLTRLRVERLDLVQFHWWDYAVPGWIETALWLRELRDEGKIDLIGGTNFDTPHTEALVEAGVPLASMQVQYSILDRRPEAHLVSAARRFGIGLLCYGSVAGGFLSERWLGRGEPVEPLPNRSLVKYKLIIDDFGGWAAFQALLHGLAEIGRRHGVGLSTVASRWVLDQPGVAGVIVGARNRDHLAENLAIGALRLSESDHALLRSLVQGRRGPLGDTYTLERDRNGPHGSIMKYNLNKNT